MSKSSTSACVADSNVELERWGWASIGVNVVLAGLHAVIAAASGSLAVSAELTHNAADFLTAVAVLIGLKLAARKPSQAFPYGLHKVENLVAAGLAGMVFLSAYEIGTEALLSASPPVRTDAWMLFLLVVTATLPLVFSHYEMRAGMKANSPSLIADAKEYRIHVFTTGLVFIALLSAWLHYPLDRFAALVIVIVVVKTGWDLLRDAVRVLLDASLDTATLLEIRQIIESEPAVAELRWLTGRSAGRFRFVEAGVTLRHARMDSSETIVRRMEENVRARVPHVERVLVHVETSRSTYVIYAVPLADASGTLSEHFGGASYFALVSVRRADGAIEEQRILSNPHREDERGKGIHVAEWLVTQKIDAVLIRTHAREGGFSYVLRNAGVELHATDEQTLEGALRRFLGAEIDQQHPS